MPTRKNQNCCSSNSISNHSSHWTNNLSHTPTTPTPISTPIADSNININIKAASASASAGNPHPQHPHPQHCSSSSSSSLSSKVFGKSSSSRNCSLALAWLSVSVALPVILAVVFTSSISTALPAAPPTTTEAEGLFNYLTFLANLFFATTTSSTTSTTTTKLKMSLEKQDAAAAVIPSQEAQENDNLKLHNNMNMNMNSIIARLTKQFHKTTTSSRLPDSYNGRNSLFLFSKSEGIPNYYSVDMSTQENYGVENNDDEEYYGKFRKIRASLDFEYHGNYIRSRQEFQDKIVEKLLDGTTIHDSTNGRVCKTPTEPWIVFTAGVMGAGKSHTMKQLESKGLFPLQSYIVVDPDEIRSHFPEYHLYAKQSPKQAGELTHREAGYVTEIVTAAAMERGYNVLVDGSLKDSEWYHQYFTSLRNKYPKIRIAILHIIAPREAIFERAAHRAKETGRVVPIETLELSLIQVPISVKKLAPDADCFCELDNSPTSGEVSLKTEGMTWDEFRDNWAQTCPWVPPSSVGVTRGKDSTDEGNGDM